MRITRVYSDGNGDSHFGEIEISLGDSGPIGRLSERLPVNSIIFRENDAGYDYDWHNAPEKQYIVLLDGEIEIEVSDGEKRIFRSGDVIFVEDVEGRGHRTRVTNNLPRRSLFVTLG
jgi:uncharacterized cupin superfamily protein